MERNNQVHPPRRRSARVDAQGNNRKRMYYKDGTSTMLFTEGTENACVALAARLKQYAEALDMKIKGHFIITN